MFDKPINELDEKCDIYAFGCLLYEMSESRPLFDQQTNQSKPIFDSFDSKVQTSRLVDLMFKNKVEQFKM